MKEIWDNAFLMPASAYLYAGMDGPTNWRYGVCPDRLDLEPGDKGMGPKSKSFDGAYRSSRGKITLTYKGVSLVTVLAEARGLTLF